MTNDTSDVEPRRGGGAGGQVKLLIKMWRVQEKEGLEMITKIPLLKTLGSIGNEAHFEWKEDQLI